MNELEVLRNEYITIWKNNNIGSNTVKLEMLDEILKKMYSLVLLLNRYENPDKYGYVNIERFFEVLKEVSPISNYWVILTIDVLYFPEKLNKSEIFDVGRLVERMSNYSFQNKKEHFGDVVSFKQRVTTNISVL